MLCKAEYSHFFTRFDVFEVKRFMLMHNPAVSETRFYVPTSYEEFSTYKTDNDVKFITLNVCVSSRHEHYYAMRMPWRSIKAHECVFLVNEIDERQDTAFTDVDINSIRVRIICAKSILRAKLSYSAKTIFHCFECLTINLRQSGRLPIG